MVNRLRDTTPYKLFAVLLLTLACGARTIDSATYSVLDAGKTGVPHLGAMQAAWLRLIHDDPAYAPRWKRLRWSLVPEDHLPLVVFEYRGEDFNTTLFPIIGDACNAFLDTSEGTVMATPHFDRPCAASEELRVRGEKALLGWEP
jgi:hypothetical protein